jgi:hypothetical protein
MHRIWSNALELVPAPAAGMPVFGVVVDDQRTRR